MAVSVRVPHVANGSPPVPSRRGALLTAAALTLGACTRPVVEDTGCRTPADCVPPDVGWLAIDSGYEVTCGVTSAGEVRCWGWWSLESPGGSDWAQVSVDRGSACALSHEGRIECWGFVRDFAPDPVGVFAEVHVLSSFACARERDTDLVVCWGWGSQIADFAPPPGPFVAFDFGFPGGCGILSAGEATCWGFDEYSEFGEQLEGSFTEISVGAHVGCGVHPDGGISCTGAWRGRSLHGEPPYHSLTLGGRDACALQADGSHICWGGGGEWWYTPLEDREFLAISRGNYHVCGITADGTIACGGGLRR